MSININKNLKKKKIETIILNKKKRLWNKMFFFQKDKFLFKQNKKKKLF